MSVPALTRTWLAATLCFAVSALLPAAARATHFPSW